MAPCPPVLVLFNLPITCSALVSPYAIRLSMDDPENRANFGQHLCHLDTRVFSRDIIARSRSHPTDRHKPRPVSFSSLLAAFWLPSAFSQKHKDEENTPLLVDDRHSRRACFLQQRTRHQADGRSNCTRPNLRITTSKSCSAAVKRNCV